MLRRLRKRTDVIAIGFFLIALTVLCARRSEAQRPVTLDQAIQSALTAGPRVALVRADSLAAEARVLSARAYPNPTVSPAWTKSPPKWHLEVEQPFEFPFLRAARIRAATLGVRGATYLAEAERASIRYEVQAAYATAAAAMMVRTLSTRNAADALEMLRITREREKVGDASVLDIKLAEVSAGEAQLIALTDSTETIRSTLELQALMGLSAQRVEILPVDSLDLDIASPAVSNSAALRVAAAQQQVAIEQANVATARANRIPTPALRVGVEWGDPDLKGLLPIIGFAVPLPIWDRNKGPIAEARAAEQRANAELAQVELQTSNAIALAEQEKRLAQSRVSRGRALLADAQRVASLSLTAYREGEYTLANVIEAQRNARDASRTFIEALLASRVAQAALIRAQVVGGPVQ